MAGSKIPKSLLVIGLKAGHAQFNQKSAISGLKIRSFQGRSFHDRWSRGMKILGTRVQRDESIMSCTCAIEKVKLEKLSTEESIRYLVALK